MKQTLLWKQIDLVGQLVMALPIVCIVSPYSRGYFLLAYLAVGAWQGLSCLLWAMSKSAVRSDARSVVNYVFAGIAGLFLLCVLLTRARLPEPLTDLFTGIAAIEAMAMLFLGPVLAIWYAVITLDEMNRVKGALKHRSELQWRQV